MRHLHIAYILCVLGILLLLSFTASSLNIAPIVAQDDNASTYSKNSSPFDVPYSQWLPRWWNWSMSIPTSEHPRENYTPEKCESNQDGPVWFLADQLGGREERTCTIPEGKAVFVPLLVGECDYGSPPENNGDDAKTKQCAMEGDDYSVVQASLDGVKIANIDRVQSGFFNITKPIADNIYDNTPGTYRAFSDGYFLIMKPLSPGEHTLDLKVSVLNPIKDIYNYNADWTYHLNVVP